MELPDARKPFLRIENPPNTQNSNEKILVHLANDPFLAENVSNSPDGSYTVGDILLEDPPNSGEYLILGRQDDTLVHINGEKTNPLPMENVIRHSPLVKQVAIIGHNQFCTAALIQLNIEEASNYDFGQIQDQMWDIVQQANQEAPSHSRLVRQLVKILPMNKTLPVTDKGNLTRQRVIQQYSELISSIYDTFFNQQFVKYQRIFFMNFLQLIKSPNN
jgi:long-subunit acyl-CoA synthetase (AMP-forming)